MKKISKSLIEKKLKAGEVDFFTEDVIRLVVDDEEVMNRIIALRADFPGAAPKLTTDFFREHVDFQWFIHAVNTEINFNRAWNFGEYILHLELFYEFFDKLYLAAGAHGIDMAADFKQYFDHKSEYINKAKIYGYWKHA